MYLQKENTHMKEAISIEGRIVVTLQRLRIGNMLCYCKRGIWDGRKYNFKNYENFL